MKNLTILIIALISIYSCNNEKVFNPLNYNPELSVSQNLTNGVSVLDILEYNDVSLFNGLEFAGGFIFHVKAPL